MICLSAARESVRRRALNMSRTIGLLFLVVGLLGAGASSGYAQISSIRIFTSPPGVGFYVDEQFYTGEVNLLWPSNSKHFVRADSVQCNIKPNTCYSAGGTPMPGTAGATLYSATTNLGVADAWPITANPGLTFIELDFTTLYSLALSYSPCPISGPPGCTVSSFPPPQAGACS